MATSIMTVAAMPTRYTRVAMWLHWVIAFFIIFDLILGHVMDPFKGPERYYILTVHQSAGITVLVLTVIRIAWRLMYSPPPYPKGMSAWERHIAAFTHFLLYAAMILMPLSGWFMISANPPAGSAGEKMLLEMVTGKFGRRGFASAHDAPGGGAPPAAKAPPGTPSASKPPLGGHLRPKPRPIKIWFVAPFEKIGVLEQLGSTADGWRGQNVLHEDLLDWHKRLGWFTIALLVLHILGALKHQYFDRQRSLQRMGLGRGD